MFSASISEPIDFAASAGIVANTLRALSNERRLTILCKLAEAGEMSVGAMANILDLAQSALSQHLAKMRNESIVACRRDGQTMMYRIADPRIEQLMTELHLLFCAPRH